MANNDQHHHPLSLDHATDPNAQSDSITCLLCHRIVPGRHIIVVPDHHYCPSCGAQLVRIGIGRYTTGVKAA